MANPKKRTDKKEQPLARVTVFLRGIAKRKFFEEVERTGRTESQLGKEIITRYYL